ncbi:adenosylcobinamide-GDP ribazoletransferase [Nakamurella sp. YIM 132087]|uniref:Adenosylcobinamide-GDP ribazoletransferase n=1 Tax=Nakamurella alba TaxID=2665158 RepID=A0A7K1FII5_9ACTN|nr:adenosylcobinamide-GDP ribazoletransferase [Nakamurella alba]MTD13073.1 adenosylcobinamide-GDP ribazoletransferase [Nakamurella alba]
MTGTVRSGIALAVGTLTALPVRGPDRIDRGVARSAMLLAPVAVLPSAVVVGLVGAAGTWLRLPELLVAVLMTGVLALSSRALHLDGLADTADGLTASYDRERALAVMRTGDVGPAGAATLVLVLLAQITAAAAVLARHPGVAGPLAVAVLVCCSRAALWQLCRAGVPSARPDGLGALVAGTVPRGVAAVGALVLAAVLSVGGSAIGRAWWLGAVTVLVAGAIVEVLCRRAVRRLGGVTGDVLGAGVESALAAMLLVAAIGRA